MFDPSDPRASLGATSTPETHGAFAPAVYAHFYATVPDDEADGVRTWYARGQTFVVAYSELSPGAELVRAGQPDEYAVLLPDADTPAVVEAGAERSSIAGFSVTFVPRGDSAVRVAGGGRVIRLFTARAGDLVERCGEWRPNPCIPAFEDWPTPPEGPKIRTYSLDVAPEEGRFGRIFRSSTFMINYLEPSDGPRDPTKLSPHHHDGFEQCSLALEGAFVHHLRWPWTPNRHDWIEDEHVHCGSPSVAVIPPPAVHTTQAVGTGRNVLVDIFCPPRLDFSEKPGWVLNAEDYPMSGGAGVA